MKKKCTLMDIWGMIYPCGMYLGITIIVQYAALIVSSFVIGVVYPDIVVEMDRLELGQYIVDCVNKELLPITAVAGFTTIPIGLLCMYFDRQKEITLGIYEKYKRTNILKYLLILPLSFSSMTMGNYFVSILQSFMPVSWLADYDQTSNVLYGDVIWVQVLTTVIMAPLIEEIIFRGLIYKRMRRVFNVFIANMLSALFFGVFHMNVVQGIYAFIIGAILAYVYERYKSIWAPIMLHACANGISVLVTNLVSSNGEIQQSQDLSYTAEELYALGILTIVMGIVTVGLLIVMHNVVKPKKSVEN